MTELMPYISGLVTLLFGAGFFLALKEQSKIKQLFQKQSTNSREDNQQIFILLAALTADSLFHAQTKSLIFIHAQPVLQRYNLALHILHALQ